MKPLSLEGRQGWEESLDVNLWVCLTGNPDFLSSRHSNSWSLATFFSIRVAKVDPTTELSEDLTDRAQKVHILAQGHPAN